MTDLTPAMIGPPARRRPWVGATKLVLLALVLAFVAVALVRQWRQIAASGVEVRVRPWPLAAAAAALAGVAAVQAVSYRGLLAAYATAPPWRAMPAIAWVPPLGKYVPGAAVFAAVAMLRRFAVPTAVAVAVVLVQDGLAVLAGFITSAPLLRWDVVRHRVPWAWWAAVPLIVAGAVCLSPAVFGRVVNLLLAKLKRPPLPRTPAVSAYALPLACAFGQWVLAGACLAGIVRSVTGGFDWTRFPLLVGFAALSQTLGYLAVFSPGGLGVREAILLGCLTPLVGPLAAVVVPIRAVLQVVVDLALAGVGSRCCGGSVGRRTDRSSNDAAAGAADFFAAGKASAAPAAASGAIDRVARPRALRPPSSSGG